VYIFLILRNINGVQVKTAKPHLKQLQQCVQSLSNQPEEKAGPVMTSDLSGVGRGSADDFLWLTRHHAYITVYLVSVLHSVQAGLTDKALSYVDRALQLINQEIGGFSYCGTSVHKCTSLCLIV
jgi:MAternally-affected-uncoordination protein